MAATDSYRMSVKETELKDEAVSELEAIVPARALTELSTDRARLRRAADRRAGEPRRLRRRRGLVDDAADRWAVPELQAAAPGDVRARGARSPAWSSSRWFAAPRVMAQRNSPLRLRFAEGEVTVSAQTQDVGEARSRCPPFTGEALEIGFNPEFLRDGLESVDTDEIALRLISPLRPGLLRSEAESFSYLIMPIRLAGLIVRNVTLRDYRSYASLELELQPGLVLAVGENGAGQDEPARGPARRNAGFLAAQPQRRPARALRVRGGADRARRRARHVTARDRGDAPPGRREEGEAERRALAGRGAAAVRGLDARLHPRPPGRGQRGPAARRAYFDRALGRLYPARASLPAEYGAAVAQRNAALRRVSFGASSRDAVAPWTERVAALGAQLVSARAEAIEAIAPVFGERAGELGLLEGALRYEAAAPTVAALEERFDADLERGSTGLGPHLDDVGILAGDRDLRRFGSQGEQRLAVLSLILAEAALLAERGPAPPLLLLDDVLSELDEGRRTALARRLTGPGQTLITATPGPPRCRSSPRSSGT